MTIPETKDWLALGTPSAKAQRTDVLRQEAQTAEKSEIDRLESAVSELRRILFFEGIDASDAFFQTAKETLFTPDEVNIGPRVRWDKVHGTPHFGWEKTKRHTYRIDKNSRAKTENGKGKSYFAYVRKNGSRGRKMKVVLLSEHIPIQARTNSISPATFKKLPQWAQLIGPLTEQKLTVLRKKARLLADISLRLSLYRKLEEK